MPQAATIVPMYLTPPADGSPWRDWELFRLRGRDFVIEAPGQPRIVATIAQIDILASGAAQFLLRVPGGPPTGDDLGVIRPGPGTN